MVMDNTKMASAAPSEPCRRSGAALSPVRGGLVSYLEAVVAMALWLRGDVATVRLTWLPIR